MVSEGQLPCTWIPLQTPLCFRNPTRRSHFTLPSYWPPFILSFSLFLK